MCISQTMVLKSPNKRGLSLASTLVLRTIFSLLVCVHPTLRSEPTASCVLGPRGTRPKPPVYGFSLSCGLVPAYARRSSARRRRRRRRRRRGRGQSETPNQSPNLQTTAPLCSLLGAGLVVLAAYLVARRLVAAGCLVPALGAFPLALPRGGAGRREDLHGSGWRRLVRVRVGVRVRVRVGVGAKASVRVRVRC